MAETDLKPLDLSNLLRHAFRSGFEMAANDATQAISDTDHWPHYDPETCAAYHRICTALSGTREAGEPVAWRGMAEAPKDGTLLRLLVKPDEDAHTSFEDSEEPYQTIGFNHLQDTTEDVWQFAGWDWSHDCITQGYGEVIGWLPFFAAPPAEVERGAVTDETVRLACPQCDFGIGLHEPGCGQLPAALASPAPALKVTDDACEHDWFDCSNRVVQPPCKSCRKCGWTVGADEERGMFIVWPWLEGERPAPQPAVEAQGMKPIHRWNIDENGDGTLSICRGDHDKHEPCEAETFYPADALASEKARADRLEAAHDATCNVLADTERRRMNAEAELAKLREALTPNADTKAAYSGKFSMGVSLRLGREEEHRRVQIPWDTIKEIMTAICARALRPTTSEEGKAG